MPITYPPELLPAPGEDDDVEVVIDGCVHSLQAAAAKLRAWEESEIVSPLIAASAGSA